MVLSTPALPPLTTPGLAAERRCGSAPGPEPGRDPTCTARCVRTTRLFQAALENAEAKIASLGSAHATSEAQRDALRQKSARLADELTAAQGELQTERAARGALQQRTRELEQARM